MNIQEYINKAIDLGNDVWQGGGASEESILILENAIGKALPLSYREFLSAYGAMDICGSSIVGVSNEDPLKIQMGWLYGHTMIMRDDFKGQYEVPDYLWVLEPHEDGAYCFNVNINTIGDEFGIVNYEPYLPETTFSEVLYPTFHEFLEKSYFPTYVNPDPFD